MGRPKRLYPLGKYRLCTPKVIEKDKAYSVELEYTWNRQAIRKSTNVFVKTADWNQKGNQGRGEIRASYGSEYKRMNQLLIARVDRIDAQLAEYNEKHPHQITVEVISGFLADKLVNAKPSAAVMVVPMNSPIGTEKRKRGWVFDALCISKIIIIDKDFI